MRKVFFIFLVLLTTSRLHAQVQQGRVKTIGRPNKAGVSLGGVTVRVSGHFNTVVTTTEGMFSFPVTEQRFRFSRISKKGYELADHDFLHYVFGYSPETPLTVAMVSKDELAREREAIEESTRSKLSERFQHENAILERKLEIMQISEEDYRKQLLALHEKYDNIDTLVSALSDRYARTDYDNIDSLRLLINLHIERGELECAQQLILSKGNLDQRLRGLEETRRIRIQMQQHEEKQQKDLANDFFQLYNIARSRQQLDSAYIFMEKRYFTDTTQVKYLTDLAFCYFPSWKFPVEERRMRQERHSSYLLKLYDIIQYQDVSSILGITPLIAKARIEGEIGWFYHYLDNDEKAIEYYKKQLQTIINGELKSEYEPLENLGDIYLSQKNYGHALSAYKEALGYCKKRKQYSQSIPLMIANTYYLMGDVENAIKEYILTEKNYIIHRDFEKWDINNLYVLQGFIAKILSEKGKVKEAATYYLKATKNAEHYFAITNDSKDIKPIIVLLRELQAIHSTRGDYKQMYACAEKALNYAQLYIERLPSAYSRLLYAEALSQMADAHANMGETSTVKQELIECLKKSEFASTVFKTRYQRLIYNIYNTFATNYYKQGMYDNALKAIDKSISILPKEIQAYQRKRNILYAIGKKKDVMKIDEKLLELKVSAVEQASDRVVYNTNPLWQFEYHYLNND